MGVIIGVQVTVKPTDGSKKYAVDISGLSFSKGEHPLATLFLSEHEPEDFNFISQVWREKFSIEEQNFLTLNRLCCMAPWMRVLT